MKRSLLFAGLAFATLSFVGCNKEADVKGLDGYPIEIQLSDIDTRTVNDGMSTKWAENDELSVFYAPTGTARWSANTKFTVTDPSANRAAGEVELTAAAYDWYLFYPYDKNLVNPTSLNDAGQNKGYMYIGSAYNGKQTQAGLDSQAHLAGKDLPVYGVRKNVAADVTPSVLMQHITSVVAVNVTNGTSKPLTVTGIDFTAPEAIVGTFFIDFSGETLGFKGSGDKFVSSTATLAVTGNETIAANGSAKFYLAIKPFAAKANDKLALKISAAEGSFEKEITLPSAVEFQSGKIKTLNITYSGGTEIDASTLAQIAAMDAGTDVKTQEVLVVAKSARGVMLAQNGTFLQAFHYVSATDCGVNAAIGDIVTMTGKVSEYAGIKQISDPVVTLVSSGNTVALPDPKVLSGLDDYASEKVELIQFAGTMKVSGNYYNVEVSGSTRKGSIQYPVNTEELTALNDKAVTATGFFTGISGSSTKYVNIMSTSVGETDSPMFYADIFGSSEVSAATTSVKISITGNVSWSIEKEDDNDPLTFSKASGEGADEVTVSFPVNTASTPVTYAVLVKTDNAVLVDAGLDEVRLTITQAAAGSSTGSHYAKVASITSGKKYLIVGGGQSYAMVPPTTSAAGRPVGAQVTINEGKIASTTEVDAYAVTITLADGTYSIVLPDNKYLVYSGSSTGLSTADTATDTWTVSPGTYGTFRFVATSNSGRILSYRAQNGEFGNCFGAYATSNVTGNEYFDLDLYELGGEVATGPVDPAFTVPESITVGKGKTAQITVTTNSDGAKSFQSANTGIATVAADGTVTGVAVGSTTITVSVAATDNYKAASATVDVTVTADDAKTLPYEEAFSNTQGEFTTDNKEMPSALTYVWTPTEKYGMKASGYVGGTAYKTESWLISPVVDIPATATSPALSFDQALNQFTSIDKAKEEATVWVRIEGGSWTALTGVTYPTTLSWTFVSSGSVDLAAYKGKKIQIGFKYTSTETKAGTWEVKNFKIAEATSGPVDPTLTVSPASISIEEGGSAKITVTTDSDGAKSFASANTSIATVAEDGTVTGVAAGTTTITVSVAATSNYNTASKTVSVTVTEAQTGSFYGKVATITSGKKYLIAGGGFAKVLIPELNNGKAASASVTITNGKITADATTNAYAVTINVKDGKYSIVLPNGKFLLYNSSTNLKIADDATDTWTVGEGVQGVFRFTSTATEGRALAFRAGSSNQFGGYAVSNITATSTEYFDIDLYELGAEPTVVSEVVLSSISVTGAKTDFKVNDTFTLGDGVVKAIFSDGSEIDVTSSAEITAPDMTTAGTKTVTVSYTDKKGTAKEVTKTTTYEITVADSGQGTDDKVIIIDGSQLTSTATTADTEKTYEGVTVVFSAGAKFQTCPTDAENEFAEKAILIGKSGAYIYNKSAMPGKITKFEMYVNKGASAKVSVGINFSDSPISAYNADAANTYTATLSNLDTVIDLTDKLSSNAKYFWYQVTNANNSQVQFRIEYE